MRVVTKIFDINYVGTLLKTLNFQFLMIALVHLPVHFRAASFTYGNDQVELRLLLSIKRLCSYNDIWL